MEQNNRNSSFIQQDITYLTVGNFTVKRSFETCNPRNPPCKHPAEQRLSKQR